MIRLLKSLIPVEVKDGIKAMPRIPAWASAEFRQMRHRPAAVLSALASVSDLKLNLGCGGDLRPGWVNIDFRKDFLSRMDDSTTPPTYLLNHDLRTALPFADGTCSCVYSSHLLEHLEYKYGLQLLRGSFRVLRPGGICRVALPDIRSAFEAYLRGDMSYFSHLAMLRKSPYLDEKTATICDFLSYGICLSGDHKQLYDEEKITLLLRHIGFRDVHSSTFDAATDMDNQGRKLYSFYVQATR